VSPRLQVEPLDIRDPHWRSPTGRKELSVSRTSDWRAGDLVRITDDAGGWRLFAVSGVEPDELDKRRAVASGSWIDGASGAATGLYDGTIRRLDRLTFDLLAELPTRGERLNALGFIPGHPRYWMDAIAEESVLLAPQVPDIAELIDGRAVPPTTYPDKMAGFGEPVPETDVAEHGREDFEDFSPALFAPEELNYIGAGPLAVLAAEVQEREYRASIGGYVPDPIRLRGLMSLAPISEVALVAVPDALHLEGAALLPDDYAVKAPPQPAAPPPPPPEPAGFHACAAVPSTGVVPPIPPAPPPLTPPFSATIFGFGVDDALAIQRRAIRLCALRADMIAVLAVPVAQSVADWRSRLDDPALDMSYAALYHPWTRVRDESSADTATLRLVPPDGAACGAIARRELRRQVWVAPANDPLRGILGLEPEVTMETWADLLEVNVNLVRSLPGDYRIMSARTLSYGREYDQLNVRRLLILLRKLLFRWGQSYVFEPHTPAFRSAFRRRLERELELLYRFGAFAGASPAESYQVVVDESVNPRASVDEGRFTALVKVSPSWPMEFLEVRLVRTGEGVLQLVEA